jgi:hypothetical protein
MDTLKPSGIDAIYGLERDSVGLNRKKGIPVGGDF